MGASEAVSYSTMLVQVLGGGGASQSAYHIGSVGCDDDESCESHGEEEIYKYRV